MNTLIRQFAYVIDKILVSVSKRISMEKAKAMNPDYFLVLPWGFRGDILLREKETIANGTKFIFPLPFVEIVS